MNKGYWVADAIATNMTAQANAIRASSTLRHQKGYHCGDIAIKRAALAELDRLDPGNPLLIDAVREKIFDDGERELWRHGWDRGSSYQADPHQVHAELLLAFEVERARRIQQVQAQVVQRKRKGWFFINRREVFVLAGIEYQTRDEAEQEQAAELARHRSASLHDQPQPR